MIKIYLARHGQNLDNVNGVLNGHRDEPLTDIGLQQALVLAKNVKEHDLQIGQVFSSPLSRAYKTAEAVTDELGLAKPEKTELLIERDFGIMTGKLIGEIETLCAPEIIKTETVTYFLSPAGAETFPELVARAEKLLDWIKQQEFTENILLVTHGDIGKMIYAVFYKLPWLEVLTQFHFGNTEILLLDEDAVPEFKPLVKVKQYN